MFLASWLDCRSANDREGAPLFTSFRYSQTEQDEGALARRDKPHAKTIPVNRREQRPSTHLDGYHPSSGVNITLIFHKFPSSILLHFRLPFYVHCLCFLHYIVFDFVFIIQVLHPFSLYLAFDLWLCEMNIHIYLTTWLS